MQKGREETQRSDARNLCSSEETAAVADMFENILATRGWQGKRWARVGRMGRAGPGMGGYWAHTCTGLPVMIGGNGRRTRTAWAAIAAWLQRCHAPIGSD